jgi:hypothetical protein
MSGFLKISKPHNPGESDFWICDHSFPDTSGGTDRLAVIAAGTVLLRQPARSIKLSVSGRISAAYGN